MIIILNGNKINTKENITISELLLDLKVKLSQIAVEVNQRIIQRSEYDDFSLKSEDVVEILNFIGGG